MHRYKMFNSFMPTTSAVAKVSTGTAIKTMLQISTPSTRQLQIISWGFSLDAPPNGTIELIQTDVAATVTAGIVSTVPSLDPNAPASLMPLGTAATGFTASAEGTTAASRLFDGQVFGNTAAYNDLNYSYQFMPDERPIVAVSKFLRVRVTFGTSVNMLTWVVWDE